MLICMMKAILDYGGEDSDLYNRLQQKGLTRKFMPFTDNIRFLYIIILTVIITE